jgi:hydrogenase nickel incorporation protein HypA/HybF
MHEFSLTQNLLDTVLKKANSRRIKHVNLLIGPFSEEREESIRFYWRDLSKGTLGEGARLHFRHVTTAMKCLGCGGALSLEDDESLCKYCQNDRLQLLNGEEIKLESIDVE